MQIVIRAKVMFHDRMGRLVRDQVVTAPEQVTERQAEDWLRRGFAERIETRDARERPSPAVGAPSSASPAAPASPQTTASASDDGGKRRRRKSPAA